MKGGPACGSEYDITDKKYVLLALFHYWLSFLIRDGGEAAMLLIKQSNFSSSYCTKLQLYIMQLLHYSFLNFFEPQFLSVEVTLCMMLISVFLLHSARNMNRRVKDNKRNSRQQPHLETILWHCGNEWMQVDPIYYLV